MDIETLNRALGKVPDYMRQGVLAYLEGRPPGTFLRAVLANDLHKAALLADDNNQICLFQWAGVLDALPISCWGSRQKVDAHLANCSTAQA